MRDTLKRAARTQATVTVQAKSRNGSTVVIRGAVVHSLTLRSVWLLAPNPAPSDGHEVVDHLLPIADVLDVSAA